MATIPRFRSFMPINDRSERYRGARVSLFCGIGATGHGGSDVEMGCLLPKGKVFWGDVLCSSPGAAG